MLKILSENLKFITMKNFKNAFVAMLAIGMVLADLKLPKTLSRKLVRRAVVVPDNSLTEAEKDLMVWMLIF